MFKFFSGAVAGALIAGFAVFKLVSPTGDAAFKDVKVTQVSGEKITHSGFNYTSGNIKFTTEAEGKGKIITEIPKTNIPEARAWMQNNNAVMLELLLLDEREYGISYLRRWNNLSAGGGVVLSEKSFKGVKVQAQYWFSL